MISLHVYMNPKPGKGRELESAISDGWLPAMADQPGFVSAALLKPLGTADLKRMGANVPGHGFEVVAFWRSEAERLAWVARPVHERVYRPVIALAEDVWFTLQNVTRGWKI